MTSVDVNGTRAPNPVASATQVGHQVRFYAGSCYPAETIARYLADGLRIGGAAVAVATQEHRAAIQNALGERGIDVGRAVIDRRLIMLDAVEALAELESDGDISAERFEAVIGGVIFPLLGVVPELRVFGEMVNVLVERGRSAQALRLEGLWNRLRQSFTFDLLCAYSLTSFGGGDARAYFSGVCSAHEQARILSGITTECSEADVQPVPLMEEERSAGSSEATSAKHRTTELFLAEAARLFSSSLDLDTTIQHVANLAVPAIADWSVVDLLGEEGSWFDRVAVGHHTDDGEELAHGLKRRYPLERSAPLGVARAIVDRRTQRLIDVRDDQLQAIAHDEVHLSLMRRTKARSFVSAPMVARGEAIGAFTLVSSSRNFDAHDMWLTEQLASSAAASIENARLFRREQRARVRVTRMQEVTAALSRASTADEVATTACRMGSEAMEAQSGALWLTRKDGSLRLAGSWGTPREFIEQFTFIAKGKKGAPVAHVAETGEAVWVETSDDYRRLAPDIFEQARTAGRIASFGAVPLRVGERIEGVICFGHEVDHRYDGDQRGFYFALAEVCSQALERARLADADRRLLEAERLAHSETHLLFKLTEAVNRGEDAKSVFEPALDAIKQAVGLDRAAILLFDGAGVMRFEAWSGLSEAHRRAVEGHALWSHDAKDPQPIFVADAFDDASIVAYRSIFESENIRALGVVPIVHQGELLGEFMVCADEARVFSKREVEIAGTIACEVAQAVARGKLLGLERDARARAELEQRRSAFLAEASVQLASSLDWRRTITAVMRLAIPDLADWCVLEVIDPGAAVRCVSVLHREPTKEALARKLVDDGGSCSPLVDVMDTGQGALLTRLEQPLIDSGAPKERIETLRALGLGSAMIVPLPARGRTLGRLSFVREAEGAYDGGDLGLAEAIGRRAGIAIDNAWLYESERSARERAEAAERALMEADRRKDQFLAVLAHELRNPLAPVMNAAEILRKRGGDDPLVQRSREIIERQVQHMARMIDDLLDASRVSRGKMMLRPERIDLASIVRATVEDRRSEAERASLALDVVVPRLPVWTQGDKTRIAQAVGNLLHNAIKFTDSGGRVCIELTVEGKSARITVKDSGVGIRSEILDRVFEPFSQDDQTLARTQGGLGIGLALVKGLVELHDGTVSAESQGPGRGSEFRIVLPLKDGAMQSAAGDVEQRSGRRRVLVIEDNVDAAEMLAALLELAGHSTAIAHDGAQGLVAAREFRPDIVLCDIGLPGDLDGYAVARAFRGSVELSACVLVALTGYGQEADRARALQEGFDLHLTKPFNPRQLEDLIRKLDTSVR
jgi:signal transduction histidine kinase/CheY-like chemotaxis protein